MSRVLYITSRIPGLTVTFIYNEILRLRALGLDVDAVSMNTPPEDHVPQAARSLYETTCYLDAIRFPHKVVGFLSSSVRHPVRLLICVRHFLLAKPVGGVRNYLRLGYHLLEAGYLAHCLRREPPGHIHSHHVNGPTSIAMYLGMLLDVPFSFTMHASMIWLDPIALDDKLRTASFCVSISEYNRQYVLKAYGQDLADKIHVIHCGVDADQDRPNISCVAESSVMRIGSVGQFNRRKGFHILLPALAELRDRGLDFKCTIIGDGEERPHLKSLAQQLDLGKHVHFAGAMLHEDVKKALPSFDIFVLPCVIAENGYRDGIPVALMEAMYFELPVVSTNILGLPELIDEGVSGILVEPGEISPLADALHALANSPNLRATLGRNGKAKVLAEFNNELSARELKSLFEQST